MAYVIIVINYSTDTLRHHFGTCAVWLLIHNVKWDLHVVLTNCQECNLLTATVISPRLLCFINRMNLSFRFLPFRTHTSAVVDDWICIEQLQSCIWEKAIWLVGLMTIPEWYLGPELKATHVFLCETTSFSVNSLDPRAWISIKLMKLTEVDYYRSNMVHRLQFAGIYCFLADQNDKIFWWFYIEYK